MAAKLTWDVSLEPPAPLAGDEAGARRRNDPSPMLLRPDESCVFEEAS